jgi:hypothetical protein
MHRFALTLALSAVMLAPAARTKTPARASVRPVQESSSPTTDDQCAQRTGYIIASS